ncbi:MAG: alkaline phosphatase family protein [Chloroflexi bacterium]|nr:alkaline phosphatase family protein [Chloroflexota bacterium]
MANVPKKVAVIGFDCAEPHLIKKHIAEGHLPNFKKLFEGGVLAANCLSPYPTITPPNWASIATGAWPGTHKVTDFHLQREGTSPVNANIFEAFSSENCKAEFVWDKLDAAGLKCIVCNYPGAWPSKMKNGIMVMGAGLSIGEMRNGHAGLESSLPLGMDQVVSNGIYPNATRVELEDADDWKNLPAGSKEPLGAKFEVMFRMSIEQMAPLSWYVLVTQSAGKGYDRLTVSPTKDYNDALFTVGKGEWSKKIYYKFKTQDGREIEASSRSKLLQLTGDAEDFVLLMSAFFPVEGWTNPPEIARELTSEEGYPAFSGGLIGYTMNFYEMDTYAEISGMHDLHLGDVATKLLTKYPWDLFYMHSHPIDWVYHSILTEMDENTCTSKELNKNAWEMHLKVLQSQDRMLGRIVEAAGEDTLFVVVSDHGAVADGSVFNPYIPLIQNGLCAMEGQGDDRDISTVEEHARQIETMFKSLTGDRLPREILELGTSGMYNPDIKRSKAFPQRTIYVYVNLKGRDPGGIVEPADYEKVQQQIIDALYSYVDPATGRRPVALALTNKDARILGLHGDRVGDVVYAVYPEFGGQHGPHLQTAEWGIGKLRALLSFYGPGIKKGHLLERTSGLTDVVPTLCHLMSWPVPADTEGNILFQALENPNLAADRVKNLKESLVKMEEVLTQGQGH